MTLHKTIIVAKKFLLGVAAGLVMLVVLILLFRLGVMIKNTLFPPKTLLPTSSYGIVPALQFPQNVTDAQLTYQINTITGTLPEFPDRLTIFPIVKALPNFLNLNKAKNKAGSLGFFDENGDLVSEKRIDAATYEWIETRDFRRKLALNIITSNFNLESQYLSSSNVSEARAINSGGDALFGAKLFLDRIDLMPKDLDFTKTTPEFFSLEDGKLIPTTSLSKTQVFRVDLFQKDMIYSLNTGVSDLNGGYKMIDMTVPIFYPDPPHSTMSFWVASREFSTDVFAANFTHQTIDATNIEATYAIKTAQEAYDELTKGKAYIAAYNTTNTTVKINNVFLAYYLGETPQEYLLPIIVFEGNDGFFAYVSAVKSEWVK